jgi:hypothetical protein
MVWHGVASVEQLETSGIVGGVVVAEPFKVIGVEVDSTSPLSVVVAEELGCAEEFTELDETAGVETPVVVANAVSTSCERINCPAL